MRVAAAALLACVAGCTSPRTDVTGLARVSIRGSETMQPLVRRWAIEYMRTTRGVVVYTEGGGSRRGIEGLIAGEIDVCCASRAFSPEEVHRLSQRTGSLGRRFLSAKDGIGAFVHVSNPVVDLDLDEVADIFAGRIRDWREVGGPEGEIRVYLREPNSGTRAFAREHVLHDAPYTEDARVCVGARAQLGCVADDPLGIALSGFLEVEDTRACRIDGVMPSVATVASGEYPIVRYLYLYTRDDASPRARHFVEWALGEAGQHVVADVGFVPLWE